MDAPHPTPHHGPEAEAREAARPVLVVGVARSGTTFLGELFRQNPAIAYLHEPFWGDTAIRRWQCHWRTEDAEWPEGAALLRDVFAGRVAAVGREQHTAQDPTRFASRAAELSAQLAGRDARRVHAFVVKEIRLNMQLRWAHAVLGPALRTVHIVRDPRGVVASFLLPPSRRVPVRDLVTRPLAAVRRCVQPGPTMYRDWQWDEAPAVRRFAPEHAAYAARLDDGAPHQKVAARWAVITAHALDDALALPPGRCLRVRYEDLCLDPSATARTIYDFLGLPLPTPVTDWIARNTRTGDRRDRYGTARNSREMPEVWKRQLTAREIAEVDEICAPLMRLLGYAPGAAAP
jgi:hypothetical protein